MKEPFPLGTTSIKWVIVRIWHIIEPEQSMMMSNIRMGMIEEWRLMGEGTDPQMYNEGL